jgi:hypothetical protein
VRSKSAQVILQPPVDNTRQMSSDQILVTGVEEIVEGMQVEHLQKLMGVLTSDQMGSGSKCQKLEGDSEVNQKLIKLGTRSKQSGQEEYGQFSCHTPVLKSRIKASIRAPKMFNHTHSNNMINI